jgi:predicted phage terminase large subunit-like protein
VKPSAATLAFTRALCARSFHAFVERAWPTIEPTRELLPSVAVDALCAALEAVAAGRIRRLAVACPPGVSKSLVAAVAFPAWLLLRSRGAARVMAGSYAWDLAQRDSRRCRDLVESPWFRSLVGGTWSVRSDANTVGDWWTSTGGRRLITSTGAKALGERATVQILDDVLSGADVHSKAARTEARRWMNEVLPSRLEDPERDARVLVGQRLHVDDPHALAHEQGWSRLDLPATLGADDEPCELRDDNGALVWRDPRAPGEPLVSLLGADALAHLRVELGSSAFSAQYAQRPHDDGASMFPRSCFARTWVDLPAELDAEVIALDASFKAGDSSDFAVIQAWASKGADRFLVEQWRRQAGFADTLAALRVMAARHPYARVLVESAANGVAIYEQLSREIPGVFEVKPDGGKVARAASVQAIIESGAVVLPANAPWVETFVDEASAFPHVKHDDQTDAMVYALRELQTSSVDHEQQHQNIVDNVNAALAGVLNIATDDVIAATQARAVDERAEDAALARRILPDVERELADMRRGPPTDRRALQRAHDFAATTAIVADGRPFRLQLLAPGALTSWRLVAAERNAR